jgi:hypothetical protein
MNNGGPAFPQHGWTSDPTVLERMKDQSGMTLRDYFAGQALAGLCANPSIHAPNGNSGWSLVNCTTDDLVGYAFHLADDALAARAKDGGAK